MKTVIFIATTFLALGGTLAYLVGERHEQARWQTIAIQRGLAEYNPTTGAWEYLSIDRIVVSHEILRPLAVPALLAEQNPAVIAVEPATATPKPVRKK